MDGLTGPVTGLDTAAQHRPRRRHQRRLVAALLAVLTMLLCAGCSSTGPFTQEDTMDAQAELAARPTLEEMIARYDQMLQRIRDRLDTELGPFTWYEFDPRTSSPCAGDFSRLGGRTTSSPLWVFDDNIPDHKWPHAQRIVADITAEYGFATAGLQIDRPGHHKTHGFDTTLDAYYTFGTYLATSLRVSSGCHRLANPTPRAPSTDTPATPDQ